MKQWIIIAAAGATLAGAALIAFVWHGTSRRPAAKKTAMAPPTLYCEFYNFTHNATVVSFNFAVDRNAEKRFTFAQLFVIEPDGTKTDYATEPPRWSYAMDDGTPTITSPDAATRIVLYGLKASTGGVFWTEAGVRSNTYLNLEGKCRQAHLDKVAGGDTEHPKPIAQ